MSNLIYYCTSNAMPHTAYKKHKEFNEYTVSSSIVKTLNKKGGIQ